MSSWRNGYNRKNKSETIIGRIWDLLSKNGKKTAAHEIAHSVWHQHQKMKNNRRMKKMKRKSMKLKENNVGQ
jgi:hypothetical protein